MKITLITVVYNAAQFLRDCIQSVVAQDYADIEYILIDGKSTDESFSIAQEFKANIDVLISEPDQGMYDAINKGIMKATGEIIGILNADDMLASKDVISRIAEVFSKKDVEAVYGDLNYVNPLDITQIQRKWRSRQVDGKAMRRGWMPAHPTFYVKKECYHKFGLYSLSHGSAADYELMLRLLYKHKIKAIYLSLLMVNMRSGGMSNATIRHRIHALINDLKALRDNGVPTPIFVLSLKKLSKIQQFL